MRDESTEEGGEGLFADRPLNRGPIGGRPAGARRRTGAAVHPARRTLPARAGHSGRYGDVAARPPGGRGQGGRGAGRLQDRQGLVTVISLRLPTTAPTLI